jgi:glycosyltransferase involved in cell wall biosynthesis
MKILFPHFFTFRLLRGIETLLFSLANELVKSGADVTIFAPRGPIAPLVTPDPRIHIYTFRSGRYFEGFFLMPQYFWHLMTHRYDVVTLFYADFGEGEAVRWASRLRKFKLNLFLCYPVEDVPHRYEGFSRRGLGARADRILADASYVARGAESFFNRPVTVIPVGTDPDRFKPDPEARRAGRAKFGFNGDEVVLLNVSALEKRKGIQRVLSVLPDVRKDIPQIRYLVMGEGTYRPELEALVRELHLDDIVVFGGTTNDLVTVYNAADVFVMMSDLEANSVASHEAMSCSLPVVASDVGGFPEVVTSNAGVLMSLADAGQLTKALIDLARDPVRRKHMGMAGRQIIETKLSWEAAAKKFMDIILEQCPKPGTPQ